MKEVKGRSRRTTTIFVRRWVRGDDDANRCLKHGTSRVPGPVHQMHRMCTSTHLLLAAALGTIIPLSAHAQARRPVVAIFAHPDDERVIAPLLSRLAREGRETHLVIATDGSKGVTLFARIPAGEALAPPA